MRVDSNIELKWENMRRGIQAQADWLRSGPADLYRQAAERLPAGVPPRVYLVGCGDSHYCGVATRLAFERWSGVATEALEALEFSRYAVEAAPRGSWVICVSNSGRVVRTVESAIFARERGLIPIALTFDPASRLASSVDAVLTFGYEDVGFGPGTLSYMASLGGLYALALHLGERSQRLDAKGVADKLSALSALSEAVARTTEAVDEQAAELGRATGAEVPIHIIGGGPNYGTALFGMAKFIEAAATPAVGQELEEWAHEQYFCTRPGTLTVVIAPPGASTDRAREQLQAVRDVGGAAAVICAAGDAETAALADLVLRVPATVDETLSPVPYCIPLELFAYHYAVSKGKTMLGFDDSRRMEVNFRQIFGSQIPTTSLSR
jgi:glucosamine--fructose-6-phosphate aminotransferase (isomerizing)